MGRGLPLAIRVSMLALACAGCTALPPRDTAPAAPVADVAEADDYVPLPPPPSPGRGGEVVDLPRLGHRLRHVALQEWQLWGRARWHAADDRLEALRSGRPALESSPAYASRVLHYWYAFKSQHFAPQSARHADGTLLPWSAVFISYLMKTAGVGPDVFPGNESHWTYIRNILESPSKRGFEALDASLHAPEVGDVICAPRDPAPGTAATFAELSRLARLARERDRAQPFHCDLVVDVAPGRLGAIGGNVHDTVVWSVVPVDERGVMVRSVPRPWLVLLRNHLR